MNNTVPSPITTAQNVINASKLSLPTPNNAPAIGLPVSAEKLTNKNITPLLTPISRTSHKAATSAGPSETKEPDVKPYSAVKTMIAALPRAGSQMASTRMVERPVVRIIMLNLPNLSARRPGMIRPKTLL